jgi:exopolysaccharide biosynthesis protein
MRNRFSRWIRQACCLLAAAAMTAGLSAGAAEEVYKLPIDLSGGMKYDAEASWSKDQNLYEDPTIRAEFHEFRENRINPADELEHGVYFCYVYVTIQDASQLRTAAGDAKDFTRGIMKRTLDIARRVQAVVAVDGDFCNSYYGEEANKYCLRQGVVYRDTVVDYLDMLLIDEDGDFHILQGGPELAGADKEEIDGKKVVNAFQFGPALVIDGEPVPDEYILDEAHSPLTAQPQNWAARICIAQIEPLHYLVFSNWHGMTLAQVRDEVMRIAPVKTAYVLDGGNSGQLVFQKHQVNQNEVNDRDIYDIIYFASAYPGE